jgi:quercetin dioxygenase-like cupin family protein
MNREPKAPHDFVSVTETDERVIVAGSVVRIKAGERHWHGASSDSPLSHITVTTVGSTSKH